MKATDIPAPQEISRGDLFECLAMRYRKALLEIAAESQHPEDVRSGSLLMRLAKDAISECDRIYKRAASTEDGDEE